MKRGRFNEEQTIGVLREQAAGMKVAELCRKHGISEPTFYAWKAKFGGMSVSDAKRLKQLEGEERQAEETVGGGDPGQRGAEGHHVEKVTMPAARRAAARGARCSPRQPDYLVCDPELLDQSGRSEWVARRPRRG
jgi:putative transposase